MEDAPNLPQLKGAQLCERISARAEERGIDARLSVSNDADAVAAGIAATRGQMDKLVRVWTHRQRDRIRALSVRRGCGRAVTWW